MLFEHSRAIAWQRPFFQNFQDFVSLPVTERRRFMNVPNGMAVLDLYCRYSNIASFCVRHCNYTQVGLDVTYVSKAYRRHICNNAEYIVADVSDDVFREKESLDQVPLSRVLHYLSTEHVSKSGRLIVIEPAISSDQCISPRLSIPLTQGAYLTDSQGYVNLFKY